MLSNQSLRFVEPRGQRKRRTFKVDPTRTKLSCAIQKHHRSSDVCVACLRKRQNFWKEVSGAKQTGCAAPLRFVIKSGYGFWMVSNNCQVIFNQSSAHCDQKPPHYLLRNSKKLSQVEPQDLHAARSTLLNFGLDPGHPSTLRGGWPQKMPCQRQGVFWITSSPAHSRGARAGPRWNFHARRNVTVPGNQNTRRSTPAE